MIRYTLKIGNISTIKSLMMPKSASTQAPLLISRHVETNEEVFAEKKKFINKILFWFASPRCFLSIRFPSRQEETENSIKVFAKSIWWRRCNRASRQQHKFICSTNSIMFDIFVHLTPGEIKKWKIEGKVFSLSWKMKKFISAYLWFCGGEDEGTRIRCNNQVKMFM